MFPQKNVVSSSQYQKYSPRFFSFSTERFCFSRHCKNFLSLFWISTIIFLAFLCWYCWCCYIFKFNTKLECNNKHTNQSHRAAYPANKCRDKVSAKHLSFIIWIHIHKFLVICIKFQHILCREEFKRINFKLEN